jgi:hypothetical protein
VFILVHVQGYLSKLQKKTLFGFDLEVEVLE